MEEFNRRKLEAITKVNELHVSKLRIQCFMLIAVVIYTTCALCNLFIEPDSVFLMSIQVLASFVIAMSQAPIIVIDRELYQEDPKAACLDTLASVTLAVLYSYLFVDVLRDLTSMT